MFLFLPILGLNLDVWGLENQAFGITGIALINFRRSRISHDSPIFMIFAALETGLKISDFSEWFWGHPRSCAPPGGR